MRPDLFTIGPFTVHGYGFMIAIGIIAAFYTTEYRAKKMGIDPNPVFTFGIWGVIGGVIGAKVLFWLTELPAIMKDPSLLLDVANGFVVYGGIIGGIISGYLYIKRKKLPFLKYLDAGAPTIALAQGFGRLGCFLAGCCYGLETDRWFGVTFPANSFAPYGVHLIPSQLIYSGANFISFIMLSILTKRVKSNGQIGALYLIFYSVGRFFLEYIRGDAIRGTVGRFSTSQFISFFILIVGLALFFVCGRFFKKTEEHKVSDGEKNADGDIDTTIDENTNEEKNTNED